MIEHCVVVQCLGDDRTFWQRTKDVATLSGTLVEERLTLIHWINPTNAGHLVAAGADLLPVISFGSAAAEREMSAAAATALSEYGTAIVEDIHSDNHNVPSAPLTYSLNKIRGAYSTVPDLMNDLK